MSDPIKSVYTIKYSIIKIPKREEFKNSRNHLNMSDHNSICLLNSRIFEMEEWIRSKYNRITLFIFLRKIETQKYTINRVRSFKVNARQTRSNRTYLYNAHDKVYGERQGFATFPWLSRLSIVANRSASGFDYIIAQNECNETLVLTENRLEGLLVPVPDDIHTSVDNRTPEIFRARSTGPILSPGQNVTRRDVPHSTRRLM